MRIFNEGTLNDWIRVHSPARAGLKGWMLIVEVATWKTPTDMLSDLTADIVSVRRSAKVPSYLLRVIFDISGNRFRLVAHVDLARERVFLKWFGTHSEYDKIDFKTVQFE